MDRIAIIGCGGSGKSTLARQLARILDVPLTHLDALYYNKQWRPLQMAEFAAQQESLVTGARWIIEGNYASTLPIRLAAADTVIFLDLPATACLWGIAQRRWHHHGGQHQADGVYDRITWNFIRYILGYRSTMRPRVRTLLHDHGPHARLITLTSRRQANRFIDGVRQHLTRPLTTTALRQSRPTAPEHRRASTRRLAIGGKKAPTRCEPPSQGLDLWCAARDSNPEPAD